MTFQQRCYQAVRDLNGQATIAQVMEIVGLDRPRVTMAMIRLARSGWLRRVADATYAVARDGKPSDGRGMAENSRANLTSGGRAGARPIAKPKTVKVKHPTPRPTTALEQALGWTHSFPLLRESSDD